MNLVCFLFLLLATAYAGKIVDVRYNKIGQTANSLRFKLTYFRDSSLQDECLTLKRVEWRRSTKRVRLQNTGTKSDSLLCDGKSIELQVPITKNSCAGKFHLQLKFDKGYHKTIRNIDICQEIDHPTTVDKEIAASPPLRLVFFSKILDDGLGDAAGLARTLKIASTQYPAARFQVLIHDEHEDGSGWAKLNELVRSLGIQNRVIMQKPKEYERTFERFSRQKNTLIIGGPSLNSIPDFIPIADYHRMLFPRVLPIMELDPFEFSYGLNSEGRGLPLPSDVELRESIRNQFENKALEAIFKSPKVTPVFAYVRSGTSSILYPFLATVGGILHQQYSDSGDEVIMQLILVGGKWYNELKSSSGRKFCGVFGQVQLTFDSQPNIDISCDSAINNRKAIIHIFSGLSHADFLKALAESFDVAAVTGDQSYLEALALRKVPVRDKLSHKTMFDKSLLETFLPKIVGQDSVLVKFLNYVNELTDYKSSVPWTVDDLPTMRSDIEVIVKYARTVLKPGQIMKRLVQQAVGQPRSNSIKEGLVNKGADLEARDKTGRTILMLAACVNTKMGKELIKAGANVNAIDDNGHNALFVAAQRWADSNDERCMESMKDLIKAGVDIKAVDKNNRTVLSFAVLEGKMEIAKFLVEHGADINAADREENTALMIAVNWNHVEDVQKLIDLGADVNAANREGDTALMQAKQVGILQKLIDAGADVNAANREGDTALVFAVNWNHVEHVQKLIDAGADVNAANRKGDTALIQAARWKYLEIFQILIGSGADVNVANKEGRTALLQAAMSMCSAKSNCLEFIQKLIEAGAEVNAVDEHGQTALVLAILWENIAVVKALIRVGANVDAKIYPNAKNGGTALMWVANVEIAKLLIQANANVSATNEYGKTALMRAAELNRLEVLQIFIAAGADVNAADQDGNTALMYAALEGHIKIVEALVEQGADVDATNHEGKTAALQVTSGQPNGSEIEKILTAASSSKPQ